MALVATAVAAPQVSSTAGAQGWTGFSSTSVPSGLTGGLANDSPAFTAAVTEDLGGAAADLFVSNHAELSEWMVDWVPTAAVFANQGQATGPADSHGAAFSDIDGDGDDDLVETSGRTHITRVFKNNAGALAEIAGHGMEDTRGRGRTVLMVDVDNDGDMDALIANLDRTELDCDDGDSDADINTPECFDGGAPDAAAPSELYLNNGSGTTWTKVADPTTVIDDGNLRYAHVTTTGPGLEPVIITSSESRVAIDTIQTDSSTLVAATNPVNTSAFLANNATKIRDLVLGDLDGDLAPEFVVARQDDFLDDPTEEGKLPIGMGQISTSSLVSKNIAAVSNDPLADNCRSVALADYDNDADLDIFGGCAMFENGQTRNVILLNDGNGNFTLGANVLMPATGANTATVTVNADFNNDGWIDTYVGGGYDNQKGEDFIFLNQGGTSNHWLEIDLVGSNPDVIGAQVFLGTNKWQVRETGHRVHRGQDMKTLHFGLGSQTTIAPLEIMWPDGTFETCTVSGGVDQRVTVTQGSASCASQTKNGLQATVGTAPDTTPPLFCGGLEVTVDMSKNEVPTSGDDVIRGTAGADTINALAGNDTICSLQGNDTINGGDGFDKVFAGLGNDTLNGGVGNDQLIGGPGADIASGGGGNDTLRGGDGNDILQGGNGLDRIYGGNGNDTVRGGTHNDQLYGNLGRDDLFGEGGNDVLRGGAWIDTFDGGPGTDGCTLTDPSGNIETRVSCETGVFGL